MSENETPAGPVGGRPTSAHSEHTHDDARYYPECPRCEWLAEDAPTWQTAHAPAGPVGDDDPEVERLTDADRAVLGRSSRRSEPVNEVRPVGDDDEATAAVERLRNALGLPSVTGGPWTDLGNSVSAPWGRDGGGTTQIASGVWGNHAAYFAACDPETVAVVVTEIDRLRAALASSGSGPADPPTGPDWLEIECPPCDGSGNCPHCGGEDGCLGCRFGRACLVCEGRGVVHVPAADAPYHRRASGTPAEPPRPSATQIVMAHHHKFGVWALTYSDAGDCCSVCLAQALPPWSDDSTITHKPECWAPVVVEWMSRWADALAGAAPPAPAEPPPTAGDPTFKVGDRVRATVTTTVDFISHDGRIAVAGWSKWVPTNDLRLVPAETPGDAATDEGVQR